MEHVSKKMISVCIPCYNEQGNVEAMYMAVDEQLQKLKEYDHEIIFCDNCSTDDTQSILKKLAAKDSCVKVIYNNRNFGPMKNSAYIMYQAIGNAVIGMPCDFQEPPEMIPQLVKKWQEGYKVVLGQKTESEESGLMFKIRTLYYTIINCFSDVPQFKQVTGFGIFDEEVINKIRSLNDPEPNFRNLVAELGYSTYLIQYKQKKRKSGKSGYSIASYFNLAIITLTNTSSLLIRIATMTGVFGIGISTLIALALFIIKICNWNVISFGLWWVAILMIFLASVQIFFIGIVGEYVVQVLDREKNRPLVVERERINFDKAARH